MMKRREKKRGISVLLATCLMCSIVAWAQPIEAYAAAVYEPLTVASGFNYDVICDSGENWTSTESLDQACGTKSGKANHACLYTESKYSKEGGLPKDGEITSIRTSGLKWKLGSYTDKNALKLGHNNSGTLTFSQIGCYQKVYILSLAGGLGTGNSATLTTTITYTDGSTSSSKFTVYDWWDSNNYATYIYMRYSGSSYDGSTSGAPYFVQSEMTVDTTKLIQSISFNNSTSGMYLSVLGVTGLTANVEMPAPRTENISPSSFSVAWEEADGASSYRIDVSKNKNFTEMVNGYNNKTVEDTSCVVTGLDRDTTYYYRVRSVDSKDAQSASCARVEVKTHKLDVTFNDNGGAGGPGMTDLTAGWQLPSSVATPSRKGYTFRGYYSSLINGNKYYDKSGNSVDDTVYTKADPERMTLYAQWDIHSSTLTIDANGGIITGEKSYTRKYNESVVIEDPKHENEDVTFLRWTLLDENGENASLNGSMIRGAGYTTFKFGDKNENVTLKAIWSAPNGSTVVVEDTVNQEISGENLERTYHHEVTDTEKGLTASDLVAEQREIKLTVDKIEVNDEEIPDAVAPIENLLEGTSSESLTYYDISVDKIIDGETTRLKELPETVTIKIALTNELANRTGYSVYRIHEGVAEKMSSSRSSTEYYEVTEDTIFIHTKKFSTYAITASNSVIGEYPEAELNESNNHAATDVQGRYVDSTGTRVYKVDVEWGAMQFVFNKHQKWDPENHEYTEEIKIVLDDSAYENGNNQIIVTNHSNADVRVGMSVVEKNLDGVEIYIKQEDNNDAADAEELYLNKVADASGSGTVDWTTAYVRLDEGMLNEAGLSSLTEEGKLGIYHQIARIVITIEAVTDSETTPLYFGD